MSESPEYVMGSEVECGDQVCGHLRRVLVDPVTDDITHLIVQPGHVRGHDRMVPVDMVVSTADRIHLRGDKADFDRLDELEETLYIPGDGSAAQGPDGVLYWPFYGLGTGALTTGMGELDEGTNRDALGEPPHFTTEDRVPEGEVELRRGDQVHATDGAIGHVHGFVVDPQGHHITHVLLEAGHLWGRRDVTIPISAVADVRDGVRLKLTRDQVRDLPVVDFKHRG